MHLWHRDESLRGWEQAGIPAAGLSLGYGPTGRLETAVGVSRRALAVIVPFVHNRVRRAALVTCAGAEPCLLNGFPPLAAAVLVSAAIHLVSIVVPSLREVFQTFALGPYEWLILVGLSASIIPMVEVLKALQRVGIVGKNLGPMSRRAPNQ